MKICGRSVINWLVLDLYINTNLNGLQKQPVKPEFFSGFFPTLTLTLTEYKCTDRTTNDEKIIS